MYSGVWYVPLLYPWLFEDAFINQDKSECAVKIYLAELTLRNEVSDTSIYQYLSRSYQFTSKLISEIDIIHLRLLPQ